MEFQSRNFQRLADNLQHYKTIAKQLVKDEEQVEDLIHQAEEKAKKQAVSISQFIETLTWFIRLLRAYLNKEYRQVPWRSLIMILAGVIYFVNPMDIVPDFIAGIGYLDDATILALVMRTVQKDVEAFREWYHHQKHSQ